VQTEADFQRTNREQPGQCIVHKQLDESWALIAANLFDVKKTGPPNTPGPLFARLKEEVMMLKVENLTKRYRNIVAVNDVSFKLNQGDIVGLLGPNGAGKSTTIKTVVGLLRKNNGNITVANFPHTSLEAKKKFTYVPEVPELYDMLTVWEHLQFIAYAYDVADFGGKAERLLERFDLWGKKDKLAKELSKGMKQKVSICCGLLPEPDLYLFDEPMIGLDPKSIREAKLIFKELSKQQKTVLVSTHLLDSIENLCGRVLVMKQGKIIVDIAMEEMKRKLENSENVSLEEFFLEVTRDE
jgi:ABC-2 type transport system ATP-binding protein